MWPVSSAGQSALLHAGGPGFESLTGPDVGLSFEEARSSVILYDVHFVDLLCHVACIQSIKVESYMMLGKLDLIANNMYRATFKFPGCGWLAQLVER